MEFLKTMLDFAVKNNIQGLVVDVINITHTIKDAAKQAPHILKESSIEELDRIHEDALAASASLDEALDEAIAKKQAKS